MNEPVKYKRLKEIATELNNKLDELEIGNLPKDELEQLTDHSRELYERLVVLRYKSYDSEVKGNTAESVVSPQITDKPPISFKLHDAPKPAVPSAAQKEEVRKIEPQVAAEKTLEPVVVKPQPTTETKPAQVAAATSINERMAQTKAASESLAEKLEHTPIADLKKSISLNQRFQFARELFKGNNQDYELSVEKLNTVPRDEALRHLNTLKSKYTWREDDPVVADFIELVERRHT